MKMICYTKRCLVVVTQLLSNTCNNKEQKYLILIQCQYTLIHEVHVAKKYLIMHNHHLSPHIVLIISK